MNVLVTGASGFVGQRLLARLEGSHSVIALARGTVTGKADVVQGSFDRFEDLRLLDAYPIDAVVHLAAVTGGSGEEDALAVNVQGTRRLYRYLLDRGCRRFIGASSIAAVGCLDANFVPRALPIPDDHECLATDAYGWSKSLVEDLARYLHRKLPDTDFIHLRFGAVVPDDWEPSHPDAGTPLRYPFVQLANVYASDVVEGIVRVLESPSRPRAAVYNLAGPDLGAGVPTAELLGPHLRERGAEVDVSYYRQPGHEFKPLYAMDRMKADFGFEPARSVRRP